MQQNTFQRYALVITKMSREKFPSFNDLKNFLAEFQFIISPRTLQRDIEHLRSEFGIEIIYNKSENGYFIDKITKFQLEQFVNVLNFASVSDVFIHKLKDKKSILSNIRFSKQSNYNLPAITENILTAITLKKALRIAYKKNTDSKEKLIIIHPYQLHEYAGIWFLIAWVPEKAGIKIYTIEKLISVTISNEKFKVLPEFSAINFEIELRDFSDEIEKEIKNAFKNLK